MPGETPETAPEINGNPSDKEKERNHVLGIDKSTINPLVEEKQIDEVSFIHYQMKQMVLSMQNVFGLLIEHGNMIGHENIEGIVQSLLDSEKENIREIEIEDRKEKGVPANQQRWEDMKEYSKRNHIKQQLIKEAIEDKQMITILNSYQNISNSINRLPILGMKYQEEREQHVALMEQYYQVSKTLTEQLKNAQQIQANLRSKLKDSYNTLIKNHPTEIKESD